MNSWWESLEGLDWAKMSNREGERIEEEQSREAPQVGEEILIL